MRGWWGVAGLMVVGCGSAEVVLRETDDVFVEPDTGVYVSDFDVPSETLEAALALSSVASAQQRLTVAQVGGRDDLWPKGTRSALTYCVDVKAFGNLAASVTAAVRAAADDWESAANVRFTHLETEDARCTRENPKVVFDVRPVKGRRYLARSFFPSQTRLVRELLIDESALPPPRPWSLTGVVRHELGHVLGLRHEHTRRQGNSCFEDLNWRAVTSYDRYSVMHYPQCSGGHLGDLTLTELDRRGVASLYR